MVCVCRSEDNLQEWWGSGLAAGSFDPLSHLIGSETVFLAFENLKNMSLLLKA